MNQTIEGSQAGPQGGYLAQLGRGGQRENSLGSQQHYDWRPVWCNVVGFKG